jgi:hypothetical protein
MGFQSHKNPNFRNFETPNLGILRQNEIWVQAWWLGIENVIRGKVLASPSSGHGESCETMFARGSLICAPKVLQLSINQLVVWFVQVHVNN